MGQLRQGVTVTSCLDVTKYPPAQGLPGVHPYQQHIGVPDPLHLATECVATECVSSFQFLPI